MTWNQKSDDQKRSAFDKFLVDVKNKPKPSTVVSRDGNLSLPRKAQNLAVKPGQKKGARSERTRKT